MGVEEGPWGEQTRDKFFMEGGITKISGFRVWSDEFVNGVQFDYEKDGIGHTTPVYGRAIGTPVKKCIDDAHVLTGISGGITKNAKEDRLFVCSLTFYLSGSLNGPYGAANGNPNGPYGAAKGESTFQFISAFPIVGFFGNEGEQINAIGILVNKDAPATPIGTPSPVTQQAGQPA